jgi:hypothetical protein
MATATHVDLTELRQNLPAVQRADARRALEALRERARVGDVESPLAETWDAVLVTLASDLRRA